MGQKVNPIGLRLGVNRTWDSRWFASGGEYAQLLHEDLKMRDNPRVLGEIFDNCLPATFRDDTDDVRRHRRHGAS